jgi:pseudouridine synthase
LQRYLALAGVASRRHSEELIVAGEVTVNGRVVRELGTQVEDGDKVAYRGRPVRPVSDPIVLVLNKPLGVVTTLHDPEGRRTVGALIKSASKGHRLVPVGRLDYDTAGVLLLTDDGALTHALTHPKFGVEKTYRATIRGRLQPEELARVLEGMALDDGPSAPAKLRVVATRADRSDVDLTIHEGRNRQVRRMFESVGHPVLNLVRLRFGPVSLGDMPSGAVRTPTERELRALHTIRDGAEPA